MDTEKAEAVAVAAARQAFERRWNRLNQTRTVVAVAVTFSLLVVLLRMS
ncbi:MAG: hypothetical protein ACOCX1_01910 [Fimbriimonadaceae bacterium]